MRVLSVPHVPPSTTLFLFCLGIQRFRHFHQHLPSSTLAASFPTQLSHIISPYTTHLSRRNKEAERAALSRAPPAFLSVFLLIVFFAPCVLRYEDESIVGEKLYPAFEEYLSLYISDLLKAFAEGGDSSPEAQARVLDRHRAYDQYNAERDPAHGLFRNYYGEAFSEDFMDNFLFELSTRPPEGYPKGGARAGGGGGSEGGRPQGGNPHAK